MSEKSKLVPFSRVRRQPDPARVAEFAATARRLQSERETATALIDAALRETPRQRWRELAERKELQTSGVLARLGELADDLERDPQRGLAIAEVATGLADAISEDAYPRIVLAQLRAHAWKDRGRALSYLARYDEALSALDRAASQLERFSTLTHDLAIVQFVRAIVLQHVRRFDDAERLLAECADVFRDHADQRFFTKCMLAHGNLLIRRGDYAGARAVLTALQTGDDDASAIAHCALGWCAIHLGNPREAIGHFTRAIARYRELDWQLETVRATYGMGAALLRLGELDHAIERLTTARGRFLERKLVEEAGLSGLEIVEAHMLRNETEAAKALSAVIADEFAAASLNRRAVAALAYLNDAMAASSATPEVVRSVRAYIHSLRTDPTREFALAN